MAKNRNPLIGAVAGETIESVRNVVEFLAWHTLQGENTAAIAGGWCWSAAARCCRRFLGSEIDEEPDVPRTIADVGHSKF